MKDRTMPSTVASWIRDLGFPIAIAAVMVWAWVFRMPDEVAELRRAVVDVGRQQSAGLERIEQLQLRILDRLGK